MAETVINMPGYDRKIASILVKNGKITSEKSEELQLAAKKKKMYLEKILIDEKIMTEDDFLATLAEEIQISPIRLENYSIAKEMKEVIDEEMAVHYGVLPISKIGDSLTVALCNPFDIIALDDIKIFTHTSELRPMLTTIRQLTKGIEEVYKSAETQINDNVDDVLAEIGLDAAEIDKQMVDDEVEEEGHENDSTIVKLVNTIILNAYNLGASDIHIEPYLETDTIVRYRIDGTCDEKMRIPKSYKSALISRIKIMCDLDISERRLPQDGKIKFKKFGPKDIELRVATIPTVGGLEDVVMRILADAKPMPLEAMGFHPYVLENLLVNIVKPYGIIFVVGPTGSGKTTTLHSVLGHLNKPTRKIWTAEDPVEIQQTGLRQVQCQPKIGLNFARCMRAFLRGDPNVIMIGEMRDMETTSTGVEAALTGHLVLSTLHTNNAPETITRLLDMGIDPFSFADSFLLVLAQRLVKRLCKVCKRKVDPTPEIIAYYKNAFGNDSMWDRLKLDEMAFDIYEPVGCSNCSKGFKGRLGIHEILISNEKVKHAIFTRAKASLIRELAVEQGMITLKQDGIIKVLSGFTGLAEIMRVCIE